MKIEEALFSHLKSHAGLSALVGTRIYPQIMPQGVTMPAVTYQKISGPREYSHGGPSELAHPRFQLSCWAKNYSTAKDIAEQVRLALQAYRGTMGGAGGVTVYGAFLENEIDLYESDTRLYHIPVDFSIWHKEV